MTFFDSQEKPPEKNISGKLYMTGERVEQSGTYICSYCGTTIFTNEGDSFDPCPNCSAGSSDGPEGFQEDGRIWRPVAARF